MKKLSLPVVVCAVVVILSFVLFNTLALAQPAATQNNNQAIPNSGALENPLGSNALTPQEIYSRVIFTFMGFTGMVALLMFIIGGLQWLTAAGSPEKIKKGRDTLMWAVLGLVVIFSSYAILRTVLEALQF